MGFTADSYLKLLQALLPQGRAWSRSPTAILTQLLAGKAEELSRVDTQISSLIQERDTKISALLLEEHEIDLGLPDDCSIGVAKVISQRRLDANAKLIEIGELSKAFFVGIAAAMGYTIAIDEFIPFWCGAGTSGQACGGQENIFYWRINIDSTSPVTYFQSGIGRSGDSILISTITGELICLLNKFKPAHTVIIWRYTGPEFSVDFSVDFDSLPSSSIGYLKGAFSKDFSEDFDRRTGGTFSFDEFSVDFDKPM